MGKGSGRRPTQVDRETEQKNWERIFPPKQRTKYEPPPLVEDKPPTHVCGLEGFNQMLGDVCPACTTKQ